MKGFMKGMPWVVSALAVLALGIVPGNARVQAAEKAAASAQGAWLLVELSNETDGKTTEPFGPNPRGSMIFTPDGHFSMTILRASLPKFAANVRTKGTVEENQAVV